jgi:hypothetical protein
MGSPTPTRLASVVGHSRQCEGSQPKRRTVRRGPRGRGLQLSCGGDGQLNAPFSTMGRPEPQITPAMRTLIADAIESLMLFLDEIDGDADHEEDTDLEDSADMEPSIGATNGINQAQAWGSVSGEIDAEHEQDGREPDADVGSDGFVLDAGGIETLNLEL